jgi:hypothetical protein
MPEISVLYFSIQNVAARLKAKIYGVRLGSRCLIGLEGVFGHHHQGLVVGAHEVGSGVQQLGLLYNALLNASAPFATHCSWRCFVG